MYRMTNNVTTQNEMGQMLIFSNMIFVFCLLEFTQPEKKKKTKEQARTPAWFFFWAISTEPVQNFRKLKVD